MAESGRAPEKTVAIIGASNDRRKYGNKAVRAYRDRGYHVVPINSHAPEIEGLRAYRSVLDVPGPIDTVLFYVPPAVGERVIGEVASKGIADVWISPGAESDTLLAKARALGLKPILACSILAVGRSPAEL